MKVFNGKALNDLTDRMTESLRSEYDSLTEEELFTQAEFRPEEAEGTAYQGYSYWRSTLRIFFKNKTAMFFLFLIAVLLLFTFIQPYLPNQKDPQTTYTDSSGALIRNAEPGSEFWFGTNSIGQDLWSMTWSGTRTSLFIGFSVALITAVLGVFIGILWGYVRRLDALLTEVYNVFDNIPTTLVLILMSYVFRPSISVIIFSLCLSEWLLTARFVRNQILILRDRDYNLASKCLGTPMHRIIIRNIVPYLISVITLRMSLAIPIAISEEVFVTYIGLGLPLSIPSLGNLIVSGIDKMLEPSLRHQLLLPAAVLAAVTVSFYIIGNAFADASDPKNHIS